MQVAQTHAFTVRRPPGGMSPDEQPGNFTVVKSFTWTGAEPPSVPNLENLSATLDVLGDCPLVFTPGTIDGPGGGTLTFEINNEPHDYNAGYDYYTGQPTYTQKPSMNFSIYTDDCTWSYDAQTGTYFADATFQLAIKSVASMHSNYTWDGQLKNYYVTDGKSGVSTTSVTGAHMP